MSRPRACARDRAGLRGLAFLQFYRKKLQKELRQPAPPSRSAQSMKAHSTNYFNTFLQVADDTKAKSGTPPPDKAETKSIARSQFELLSKNPYRYTSDELLSTVHLFRKNIPAEESEHERKIFFSKGQPCLRTSPLAKTYGFGIHFDASGKAALVGMETEEYAKFAADTRLVQIKAMRSSR